MYLNAFIALTEKDKRIIFILFLLIIVIIAFLAVIGALITRIMKWQGKRMDELTHDVVITNVIDNKKDFKRYARIKSWRLFVVQSWKPLVIIILAVSVLLIRNAITGDWAYDLGDYKVTGFNTLFFIWDFNDPSIFHNFFGINIICDWPKIISYPHFSPEAWVSYLFFTGIIIGGTWYLIVVQALIARTIKMYKLSYSIYTKSLEGYNKFEADSAKKSK